MANFDELKNPDGILESTALKQIIPYDHPFLMIDKVTEISENKIIAQKNLSVNEDFFKGHFVGFPIMPIALMIEGLGQAGTVLVRNTIENHRTKEVVAFMIKQIKIDAPAFPGDSLQYEVTLVEKRDKAYVMQGSVIKDKQVIAEGMFILVAVDRKEFRSKYSGVYK